MAIANCDQYVGVGLGAASAGLGGANIQGSSVEAGPPRKRFTFTIPASGAGSAQNDVINIGDFNVFDRIFGVTVLIPAGGLGAGTTIAIGKTDSNNSANTDASHYLAATDTSVATMLQADKNLTEQAGVAPTGAATDSGNGPVSNAPGGGYGNGPIKLTLTIGGSAPTAAVVIQGWIDYQTPAAV